MRNIYLTSISLFQKSMAEKGKSTPRGAFHKAGFTCRNTKRSTDDLFVLLFTRLAWQGIVCYTFQVNGRAVISLPCVKGGGSRKRDGGIVKAKFIRKTIPQPPTASAPFTQGSLWFVRPESPSTFPDKHCFCGHKSNFYFDFSFISAIPSLNPSRKPYQLSFTL